MVRVSQQLYKMGVPGEPRELRGVLKDAFFAAARPSGERVAPGGESEGWQQDGYRLWLYLCFFRAQPRSWNLITLTLQTMVFLRRQLVHARLLKWQLTCFTSVGPVAVVVQREPTPRQIW